MKTGLSGVLGLSAALAILSASAAVAAPAQPRSVSAGPDDASLTYRVSRGDTLFDLAQAYLLRPSDYSRIQRLNRVNNPRRLQIGQNLILPINLLRSEPERAQINHFRGPVQIDGHDVTPGQGVSQGSLITTGANAFLRLGLSDGSHMVIPSNSRVRLTRLRRYLINGAVDHHLTVERGRVENHVAPRQVPGQYRVTTPVSVAAVRGTDFRVAVNQQGETAAVEVLEGSVLVHSLTKPESLEAPASTAVKAGVEGLIRLALLPVPALLKPREILTGTSAVIELHPLAGARAYRGRLATDAGMVEALAETNSLTEQTKLDFGDLANGVYYLQISALSPEGVEGRSTVYRIIRVKTHLAGLAAQAQGDAALRAYRFRWHDDSGASSDDTPPYYRFVLHRQLAEGQTAPTALVDRPGLTETGFSLTNLSDGVYVWQVQISRHKYGQLIETWSDPQQLRIGQ